jgi:hypothetical protein
MMSDLRLLSLSSVAFPMAYQLGGEGRVARQQTTEVRRSTATKSKQCPRSGI